MYSIWDNFFGGSYPIWYLTLDHIGLCVIPILVGFFVSIPLGYLASRSRGARSVLISVFSILYTLPSIVLFVVVPVTLGLAILDPTNVIVALSIYAVAIMVRSSADAFSSVSADVRESARAVGYSPAQRFFQVELPLAGPVLLAGMRIVSVSTVSLATVGVFIGIPSLGLLFTDAFNRQIPLEAVTGIVAILILALIFDVILSTIARILLPWNRRVSRRQAARIASKAVVM
jgi:osmoprotectant transport system permease protein